MTGMILKYQDMILENINKKLSQKLKNQHIKLDQPVLKPQPEEAKQKIDQEYAQQIKIVKGSMPDFKIKVIKSTAKSALFNEEESRTSKKAE